MDSFPSTRLNTTVPYEEVLRLLGSVLEDRALPTRTACPLCRGRRLTLYEDTTSGGVWHHCLDCQHAGDMIELAGAVWDMSPGAALKKLARLGAGPPPERLSEAAITGYLTHQYDLRRRLLDFWRQAQDYLVRVASPELSLLKNNLRLNTNLAPEAWRDGPGRMLGAAHHYKVEELFTPQFASRGHHHTVFLGGNWGEVLTVPYHSLPGNICGFEFAGRLGRAEDRRFKVPVTNGPKTTRPEAGLAGLWTLDASSTLYGPYALALGDVFLALRLQMRHYVNATKPLPLVCWYDGPGALTRRAWVGVGRRQPVIWGWSLTPAMIYQAYLSNGLLSVVPADTAVKSVDHYIRNNEPLSILRKALKRAGPWKKVLAAWAESMSDGRVEEMVIGLERYGLGLEQLADVGCRLDRFLAAPAQPRRVRLGGSTVIEDGGCWWGERVQFRNGAIIRHGARQKVLNGVLRVDRFFVRDEVVMVAGRFIHEGTEIPFEIPRSRFQCGAIHDLERILVKAKGVLLEVGRGWGATRLLEAARAFQTPQAGPETAPEPPDDEEGVQGPTGPGKAIPPDCPDCPD